VVSPLKQIQASLRISWKEGIAAAVMGAIIDYYLIPYGLFMGATVQEIGFLVSLPHLLASMSQLHAVRAVQWAGSRLRFLVVTTAIQGALLIPMALVSFFPFRGRILILIAAMILFRIVGNFIATAWGSLTSDYLPANKRGIYFGSRSQAVGLAGVATLGIAGLILFFMKAHPALGFFWLFAGAAAARLVSCYLMAKMVDLPLASKPESDFTFLMFVRRFRESNFVKYVLYVSSVTFAAHVAGPYFSVFMLRDLQFNYLHYMAVHLGSVLMGLLSFPIWGRHADLIGNAKILKITSLLVPLIPFAWLFSRNLYYLIAVEMFAGFAWGGFQLCASNYIYDAVSPEKRVRCLGYFNLITGTAIFAGTSLGGFLADRLPPLFGPPMCGLFLLSAILRFAAHFLLSPKFREVRATAKPVSSMRLFLSVLGLRPIVGDATLGESQEWNLIPSPKIRR
jgi:MFS family permease